MPVKKTFYVDIIIHIHMHAFLVNSERKSQDFPKEASLHLLPATLNLAKQKVCMEKRVLDCILNLYLIRWPFC